MRIIVRAVMRIITEVFPPTVSPGRTPTAPLPHGRGSDTAPLHNCRGSVFGLCFLLGLGLGCAAPKSTFSIADRSTNVQPRIYETVFDECYFDFDRQGNVELIFRRVDQPAQGGMPDTEQILHLRSVWQSIPGRTFAERSQINGMATYAILCGRTGATYEGAGSILFFLDTWNDVLSGTLDQAVLKPLRRRSTDSVLFDQITFSGSFKAKRDRRQVVRAANNLARIFGPLPPPRAMEGEN